MLRIQLSNEFDWKLHQIIYRKEQRHIYFYLYNNICRRIYFCILRYNYLGYLLRGSGRLVTRFYDFLLILVTLLNRLPREYLNSKVRPKYPSSYNLFWRNTLNVINKIQFRNSHRYGQQALIAANPHFHYLCYMPRSFNFLKHKYQISAFLYTLSKNLKPHLFPSKKVLKYSTCAKKVNFLLAFGPTTLSIL